MAAEFLIAAMHQTDCSLIEQLNIDGDAVIINQNDRVNCIARCADVPGAVKMVSVIDRGLSKSRNMAIEHATADYCIIADDDVRYVDHCATIVADYHRQHADYAIIAFNIKDHKDGLFKYQKNMPVNWLSAMKLSSVQLTFKRQAIVSNDIRFHESFGAGASYISGEENIFLNACMKQGLKVLYIPKTIGCLMDSESTWFTGHNQIFFESKGAMFAELSPILYPLLILQFAVRKQSEYRAEMSFARAVKHMFAGGRKHRQSSSSA